MINTIHLKLPWDLANVVSLLIFSAVAPICPLDKPNQCKGTTECYSNESQCDNVRDCADGSDEELCRKYLLIFIIQPFDQFTGKSMNILINKMQ